MPESLRVTITGRVQGVGFRAWVAKQARRQGVTGWVRNLPEGEVQAEFHGPREALNALLALCQRGPLGAEVRNLDYEFRASECEPDAFEIRYS